MLSRISVGLSTPLITALRLNASTVYNRITPHQQQDVECAMCCGAQHGKR